MGFPNEMAVTIVSSVATGDDYGNTTATETRTRVPRVLYAPRSSQERTDSSSPAVITAGSFYFLEPVVLDSDDRIEVADVHPLVDGSYEIEGIPGYWGVGVEVAVNRVSAV